MSDYPGLLTVAEVAFYLRIKPERLRRLVASGRFPAIRIGKQLRIRRDDLERLLEDRKTTNHALTA
jgi:excisionase family DNA binding protein